MMSWACSATYQVSNVHGGCQSIFDKLREPSSFVPWVFQHGVQLLQLDPRVLSRESPTHLGFPQVSVGFPRLDFADQEVDFIDATIEPLTRKDAQLGLRHVQPSPMLGGVVKLQSVQE